MYNILVVDDDETLRRGIIQIVHNHFSDITKTYQAADGLEAVELVCAVDIDLIIADIKMPLCDGNEMIEKLNDLGFQGEIIILSGFDDYSYVRQAMKLGATDYILKPVEVDEFVLLLKSCLRRASLKCAELIGITNNAQRKLLEQQYRFKKLLEDTSDVDEFTSTDEKLVMIAVDHSFRKLQFHENEKTIVFMELDELASSCFKDDGWRMIQGISNALWGIALLYNKEKPDSFHMSLVNGLQLNGRRFGVSGSHSPKQAVAAWREAVAALERHFYNLSPQIEPDQEFPFDNIQTDIRNAVCACASALLIQHLRRLIGLLCYRCIEVKQVRQMLVNLIYSIMNRESGFIGIVSSYIFTDNDIFQIIQDSPSASVLLDEMTGTICIYMEDLVNANTQNLPGDEDYTVQRMKRLIEENYRNEISLHAISEKLEMHPNYLSTLFKRKTGVTYSQYLRRARIGKAKDLMEKTNLKIYTIAEQVGYKDCAHFNRAFKNETGMPPTLYRNSIHK